MQHPPCVHLRFVINAIPSDHVISKGNIADFMAERSGLPVVTGSVRNKIINILLINPNSSEYMTRDCLNAISQSLPPDVRVYGFTAPHPAPTAIESQTDAVLSTEACIRAIVPIATDYDAFLVACFRDHPLIAVLKEAVTQPVLGIMEAAMYAARMVGEKMGIICTSLRSQGIHARAVANYGLAEFCAGCEATQLGVLELDSKPKAEVHTIMAEKIGLLVHERKADCILLGCAGMAEMRTTCEQAVTGTSVQIIDGVGIGIQFLVGLVRERIGTAKGGIYRDAIDDRQRRKQDWL